METTPKVLEREYGEVGTIFITVEEAAEIAQVHRDTIFRWLHGGKIPGFQSAKKGKWRINRQKFIEVLSGLE